MDSFSTDITALLKDKVEQLALETGRDDIGSLSDIEIKKLLHELNVHHAELALQNEELRQIQHQLAQANDNFIKLFELAPVGYLRLDSSGKIQQANQTFQRMLGLQSAELDNQLLANFIYPDDLVIFNSRYTAFYKQPENKVIELRLLKPGSQEAFYVELKGRKIKHDFLPISSDHNEQSLLVNFLPIERHKALEDNLKLAAKVFDNSEQGIMVVSADNQILRINSAFTKITGYTFHEVAGKNPRLLKSEKHSQTFYQTLWSTLKNHGTWEGEICNKRKNGELYLSWLSISTITDIYGRITHYIGIFSDITRRKQYEKHINHLAHYDGLTNLPNRILLHDRLKQAILLATRKKQWITVFFLDLDRFKTLNDTQGHFVGDQLLQEVSKRLKNCVRQSDTVARFGGDEFVIVLTNFEDEDSARTNSEKIARNILHELSCPFLLSGQQFNTSSSIGFTLFPKDGNTVGQLIKNADTAMYYAKSKGRNNFQYYSDTLQNEVFTKGVIENDLHNALKNNEFVVLYQPIVDIHKTETIVGFEALLRWQHPQRGLMSPDEFLPIAEESNMISALGKWVLETACKQLKQWHAMGHKDLKISINFSAQQFLSDDLFTLIRQTLDETQLDAKSLDIEITETVLMQNMKQAGHILNRIILNGSTVSLDDFGTGYSSLTYLKKFPIQRIKIDKSFIKNIETDKDDQVIVKSVMAIAKQMQLEVLIEGVESKGQLEFLQQQHCHYAQGFYFSSPLPAESIKLSNQYSLV